MLLTSWIQSLRRSLRTGRNTYPTRAGLKPRRQRFESPSAVERLEDRTLLSALVIENVTIANASTAGLTFTNTDFDIDGDGNLEFDALVIESVTVQNNNGAGISINLSDLMLKSITIESVLINNNFGNAVDVNLQNVTLDEFTFGSSTISTRQGFGAGIRMNLGNTDIGEFSMFDTTVSSGGGAGMTMALDGSEFGGYTIFHSVIDGVSINATNGSAINNASIKESQISGNTGADGLAVTLTNSHAPNFIIEDNTTIGAANYQIEGISFNLTNSPLTGLTIENSIIQNNTAGGGVNFTLNNSDLDVAITNSEIRSNTGHGVAINTTNSNVGAAIVDNVINANTGNAIFVNPTVTSGSVDLDFSRLVGDSARKVPGSVRRRISGNTMTNNGGGAIFNLPNNTNLTTDFTGNTVSSNQGPGFQVTAADKTAARTVTFHANVGGPNAADGNVFDQNRGAGIALTLQDTATGDFEIRNNTITRTQDDNTSATRFAGDAVYVALIGTDVSFDATNVVNRSVIDSNLIGTNAGGASLGNVGRGIALQLEEASQVRDLYVTSNTVANNSNDGLQIHREDDARIRMFSPLAGQTRGATIRNNTFDNNSDAIEILAQNGSDDIQTFEISSNTLTNNRNRGIALRVEADAQILADIMANTIQFNASDGIELTSLENSFTDQRDIGGTWIKNTISNNAGHGIDIAAQHGNVSMLYIGLDGVDPVDGRDRGNSIEQNRMDGIQITRGGVVSITNNLIDSNGMNTNGTASGLGGGIDITPVGLNDDHISAIQRNSITNNMGTDLTSGIGIDINADNAQRVTSTIRENLIRQNTSDGIELQANFGGNILNVTGVSNFIENNGGRGVDLLNQQFSDSNIKFGDGTIEGRNYIVGNALEGFYVVNTSSAVQSQSAPSTAALDASGLVDRAPNITLQVDTNIIQDNGLVSNLGGTGLIIRVGTSNTYRGNYSSMSPGSPNSAGTVAGGTNANGRINARVVNNSFEGNLGSDVYIHSFTSTVNPATTTDIWTDPAANPAFRVLPPFERDPLARLNMVFEGNLGNGLDVVQTGAFYNNSEDVFKSRTPKTAPNPSGPFNSATRRRNAQRVASRNGEQGGAQGLIPNGAPNPVTPDSGFVSNVTTGQGGLVPANVIVTTNQPHGLTTGRVVEITGVFTAGGGVANGMHAANGVHSIQVLDANRFELLGTAGIVNPAYGGGGQWSSPNNAANSFLYDGMGLSTFRIAQGYDTAGTGANHRFENGDNFINEIFLPGTIFGELSYGWDIWVPTAASFPDPPDYVFHSSPTSNSTKETTFPLATISPVSPDPRTGHAGIVTVEFTDDVTGVDIGDFLLTRDGVRVDISHLTVVEIAPDLYTIDLTSVTSLEGAYELTLNVGAPTADIVDVTPDPRFTDAGIVTVHFSEDVTGVDIGDFALTRDLGDGIGPRSVPLVDPTNGQPLAVTQVSPSEYTVDLSSVTDIVGFYHFQLNATSGSDPIVNTNGTAVQLDANDTWVRANTAPRADIVDVTPDPRTNGVNEIIVEFDELVTGVDINDFQLTRTLPGGGASTPVSLAGVVVDPLDLVSVPPNQTGTQYAKRWRLSSLNLQVATTPEGTYTLRLISGPASQILDVANSGNPTTLLAFDAVDTWQNVQTGPTPTFNVAPASPTMNDAGIVELTFDRAVTGVTLNDFTLTRHGVSSLTQGIGAQATTFTVADASVFPTSGNFNLQIRDEQMQVIGIDGNVITVIRGVNGTVAAAHSNGTAVKGTGLSGAIDLAAAGVTLNPLSSTVYQLDLSGVTTTDGSYELRLNRGSTLLSGAITSTQTFISVADATKFRMTAPFNVRIGSEELQVTAVQGNNLFVVRGVNGTTATSHANFSPVSASLIVDSANNVLVVDAATTWIKDGTMPVADIVDVTPDPRTTDAGIITIRFTEPVTNVDISDFTLTRDIFDGLGPQTVSLAGQTLTPVNPINGFASIYTLDLRGNITAVNFDANERYELTLNAVGSGIVDSANNALAMNAVDTWLKFPAPSVSPILAERDNGDVDGTRFTQPIARDTSITWLNDTTQPVADIIDVTPDPRTTAAGIVTVKFSEAVNGVDINDFLLTRNGVPVSMVGVPLQQVAGDEYTLDLTLVTSFAGDYVLTLLQPGSNITDIAGNPLLGTVLDTWSLDITLPSADIVDVSPDPRSAVVGDVVIVFAEPVTGVDLTPGASDFLLTRNGVNVPLTGLSVIQDSAVQYRLNLSSVTMAEGTYELRMNSAGTSIRDAAGNPFAVDAVDTWVIDTTAPVADIEDVTPDPRFTAVGDVIINFNEPIQGFDINDLTLVRNGNPIDLGPAGANLTLTQITSSKYVINLSGITGGAGVYELRVNAAGSGITDIAGNALGSDAIDVWLTGPDATAPVGQFEPVIPDPRTSPVNTIYLNFDEEVRGINVGPGALDFRLTLDTDGPGAGLPVQIDLSQATVTRITPARYAINLGNLTDAAGTYELSLLTAGSIVDLSGNPLTAGVIETWVRVSTGPVADIVNVSPDPRVTAIGSVTVNFTEDVTGVDINDFNLTRDGAAVPLTGVTLTPVSGSQYVLSLPLPITDPLGTYQLTLRAAGSNIQNLAGDDMTTNATDQWVRDIVLYVNSSADAVDVSPGDGISASATGNSTLRGAIMEANALPGENTIVLGAGVFQITRAGEGEDGSLTGDFDILDNLNIVGAGVLQGSILGVSSTNPMIINSANHGLVTGHRVEITGVLGAVAANGTHTVTVIDDDSFIVDGVNGNTTGTYSGGGTWKANATVIDGGDLDRVFHVFNGVTLNLTGVTVTGGQLDLSNDGGAIRNSGTVTITDSVITGNSVQDSAGAINNSGNLTIVRSTISDNHAVSGNAGGIRNTGSLTIIDSTMFGNTTAISGGAILNLSGGTADLINTTISGNSGGNFGGAIRNSGEMSLTNVTLTNNSTTFRAGGVYSTGTTNVRNTIIAGNSAISGDADVSGLFTSQGNNLIGVLGTGIGFSTAQNDQIGFSSSPVNAQLTPLRDNGGPTLTHALILGSPAIDAGNNANLRATEQRSAPRILDGDGNGVATVDIGAVEFGNYFINSTADTIDANPGDGFVADANGFATLRAAIHEANQLPGQSVIILDGQIYQLTLAGADENQNLTGDLDITDTSGDLTIIGIAERSGTITGASNQDFIQITSASHGLQTGDLVTVRGVTGNTAANGIHTVTVLDANRFLLDGTMGSTSGAYLGGGTWSSRPTVIDANGLDRAFHVMSNVGLTLQNVAVTGGNVTGTADGGGILNLGALSLQDSTLYFNEAENGGAIYNDQIATVSMVDTTVFSNQAAFDGGGLYINDSGIVSITGGTIAENRASDDGGGIYIDLNGTLNLNATTVRDNQADFDASGAGKGGGIYNNDQSRLTITGSTLSGNSAVEGGGIFNELVSVLTLSNSTLLQNRAEFGAGIYNEEGNLTVTNGTFSGNQAAIDGGGIYSTTNSQLVLTNSTIADNSAGRHGGGIVNFGNVLTITDSTLSDNVAGSFGGSLYNNQETGTVTLTRDTFLGNQAAFGGAIYNTEVGQLVVTDGTFRSNQAVNDGRTGGAGRGGALFNAGDGVVTVTTSTFDTNSAIDGGFGTGGDGGAIFNSESGIISITRSTISRNEAEGDGGGLLNTIEGRLTVSNSTVSGNVATGRGGAVDNFGALTLTSTTVYDNTAFVGGGVSENFGVTRTKNTIIAGNMALSGVDTDVRGDFVSDGNNLIGDVGNAFGFTAGVKSDLVGDNISPINPALGALQDNGGPTETHALLFGSPARDAGSNIGVPGVDQRGFARLFDGDGNGVATIDIGAFESGFVVNDFGDSTDEAPGDGVSADSLGRSTLRSAIMEANARPGDDTIILGAGTYTLSLIGRNEDGALTGDLDILGNLQIIGVGVGQTIIDASEIDRVFQIFAGVNVRISGVTITGGDATTTSDGGAINNAGTLILEDSEITGSFAKFGGGIYNTGSLTLTRSAIGGQNPADGNTANTYGGGLYNAGTLTVNDSQIQNNTALLQGGGLYNIGTSTITTSTLQNNEAFTHGGAIYNAINGGQGTSTVTIDRSTLANNTASSRGGAIFNNDVLNVTSTTVSGNVAGSTGGALYNDNTASSGGVTAVTSLVNSTITDNSADSRAGGIFNRSGAQVSVRNTILAANSAAVSDDDLVGTFTSLGYNLIGSSTSGTGFTHNVNGDQVGTSQRPIDPKIGPLQDNGGPTLTHSLLVGSPAVDSGNNTGGPAIDQRGAERPMNTNSDIGAYEVIVLDLSIDDITQEETDAGQTVFEFTVTLSRPSSEIVTVDFSTADATAQDENGDRDYTSTNGTLTFNPGQVTRKVRVMVNGDNKIEPNETFFVNLTNAAGAVITDGQGLGTILNDETSLSIEDVAVDEGDSGTTAFVFTISLAQVSSESVTVQVDTSNGFGTNVDTRATLVDSDYNPISILGVTFAPGEVSKTVTVLVNGDTKFELDEEFAVNLSNANNASIRDNQAIGLIRNDDVRPSLTINDMIVTEGDSGTTALTFTVLLSNRTFETVNVNYQTADGTATGGSDFVAISPAQALNFQPDELSQTITVLINGDSVVERNEEFFLNLFGSTNASIADGQGRGTIINDDVTTLIINDVEANEGDGGVVTFTFTVTLSDNPVDTDITVDYTTVNGTAEDAAGDGDYTAASGTLTFTAGLMTQQATLTVAVNGDEKVELDEVFNVVLSNLQAAGRAVVIGDGIGVGTITNDDSATVSIQPSTQSVPETDGPTTMEFTVRLSREVDVPVTVFANTVDLDLGAAAATVADNDYVPLINFPITFAAGETLKTLTITINGDNKRELDESFRVELSSVSSQTRDVTLDPSLSSATGLIQTDDLDDPSISVSDVTSVELNAGATSYDFVVTLSNPSYLPVTVNYATANGTATVVDGDYQELTGTLTFNPNEMTKTVSIVVKGDTKVELDETFFLNLDGATVTNATIADGQGVGTIQNDDATGLFVSNVSRIEGDSGTSTLQFTVSLGPNAVDVPVNVRVQTVDGTASAADGDYVALTQDLTFPAGVVSAPQTVTVTVNGDRRVELNESFLVTLMNLDVQGRSVSISDGVGTITNDDAATVSIGDAAQLETDSGTTAFNFTVTLSRPVDVPVTMQVDTSNGSATAGSDYTPISELLTFNPGETSKNVTVIVNGDTTNEPDEEFFVRLTALIANGRSVTFARTQGIGTIIDDEPRTFVVNSLLDKVDLNPGDGVIDTGTPGEITLRAAIMEANSRPNNDTIIVGPGHYRLTLQGRNEDAAATGDLDITDTIGTTTIVGGGVGQTIIDAAGIDRVFHVFAGTNIEFHDLTLTGGNASSTIGGGGILNYGNVNVLNSQISGNLANGGVGLGGGGIRNIGNVTVTNTTISGNSANGGIGLGGGGINNTGSLLLINSTVSGNSSDGGGNLGGGGLRNTAAATISNSTISGNSANATGGGGGIHNSGAMTVVNTTVTQNVADGVAGGGGGLRNSDGGTIVVGNSIVAGNFAVTADRDLRGTFSSLGNNLIGNLGTSTGFVNGTAGDIVGGAGLPVVDAKLGTLQNNGGPTFTHALLPGSPAIDAGNNVGAPATDQRGFDRIIDGDRNGTQIIDIGAVELRVRATITAPATIISNVLPTFRWTGIDHAVQYDLYVENNANPGTPVIRNLNVQGTSFTAPTALPLGSYTAYVQAIFADGSVSGFSSAYPFSIVADVPAPTAPTVTAPIGSVSTAKPTFRWDIVQYATTYSIVVDNLSTGKAMVINATGIQGTSYTAKTALSPGNYRVQVQAMNSEGDLSPFSAPLDFVVTASIPAPPAATTPVGLITETTAPIFNWTPVPGAARYDLWVNDLTTGQSGVIRNQNVGGTTFIPTTELVSGHSYVWTVRGIDANGVAGDWAPHRNFSLNTVLSAPSLVSPIDTHVGLKPQFTWTAIAGADHYDIWVNDLTTNTFAVIRDQNINGTTYTPATPLEADHEYIWTVRAVNTLGTAGKWASHRTFTALASTVPTLITPVVTASTTMPTFEWTPVDNAVRYDIWVNDQVTGQSGVIRNTNVNGTSYTHGVPLVDGHVYIWTVRGIDAGGNASSWAAHETFTVNAVSVSEPPALMAPVTNGSNVTFQWQAVTGAIRYDIWVNDLTTGQSGVVRDQNVAGTSYTAALTLGHSYIWTVRAIDSAGNPTDWATHKVVTVAANDADSSSDTFVDEVFEDVLTPEVQEILLTQSADTFADLSNVDDMVTTTTTTTLAMAKPAVQLSADEFVSVPKVSVIEPAKANETDAVMAEWADTDWWKESAEDTIPVVEGEIDSVTEQVVVEERSNLATTLLSAAAPVWLGGRFLRRRTKNDKKSNG